MSAEFDHTFGPIMGAVAEALLGKPTKRTTTELRYGSRGSFSVDLTKGTWHDHEQQTGGGVLALVERQRGLRGRDAVAWLQEQGFDIPSQSPGAYRNGNGQHHEPAPKAKRRIVATYEYQDCDGEPVFEVIRFEPKDFRQRRPARAGEQADEHGHVWNLQGVQRIPFMLPELLDDIAFERQILLVEGEKDVLRARKEGFAATTIPGGANKWFPDMGAWFKGADVIIVPDNDPAGEAHVTKMQHELADWARRVRVARLPSLPDGRAMPAKGDLSDWFDCPGADREVFQTIINQGTGPDPSVGPLGHTLYHAIGDAPARQDWMVQGIIARDRLALMYGESRSGKTFLALDLALAIARGATWMGRRTRQAGVIYLAAEGRQAIANRIIAHQLHHEIPRNTRHPFALIGARLDLFANDDGINSLLAEIKVAQTMLGEAVGLIVIDTLAAVSPGMNENASEDMSRIITRAERLREATGAAVLLVHHKPAGADRPRGHTSLLAAVDTAIDVTRKPLDEGGTRTWRVDKQKDGEETEDREFGLHVVPIGLDDEGQQITSCVITTDTIVAREKPSVQSGVKRGTKAAMFFDVLTRCMGDHGQPAPPHLSLPNGTITVTVEQFDADLMNTTMDLSDTPEARRKRTTRAIEELLAQRLIGLRRPYIWRIK